MRSLLNTGLWCTLSLWCYQQFRWVSVWHYHYHLLRFSFSQQVVQDIVHTSHLIVHLFRIGSTTDQIEHWIFLLLVFQIAGWQIDHGIVGGSQTLREIVHILYATVGHITDVMRQTVLRGNLQQTVLKTFVGEILGILRIHDANTVNDIAIGVHIGGHRTKCHRPCAVGSLCHFLTASKLHIHQHALCRVVLVLECHRTVVVCTGLRHRA